MSPYSEHIGPYSLYQHQTLVDPADPRQAAAAEMGLMSSQRPPVGPGGGFQAEGHATQVWLPPYEQLQELEEELDDDDEPDGAENILTMIEEMEEVDFQHPPKLSNPIAEEKRGPIVTKKEEKSNGLGFGIMQGLRLSKKSAADKKTKQGGNVPVPAILKAPKEPDPEFKGFDGFFMY